MGSEDLPLPLEQRPPPTSSNDCATYVEGAIKVCQLLVRANNSLEGPMGGNEHKRTGAAKRRRIPKPVWRIAAIAQSVNVLLLDVL